MSLHRTRHVFMSYVIIHLDLSRARFSFLNFSLIIQLLLWRFVYLKLNLVFKGP